MKKLSIITLSLLCYAGLVPVYAFGIDITGDWTGTSTVNFGGGAYQNSVTFVQHGTQISGHEVLNNSLCPVTGTLVDGNLTFRATCPDLGYFSDNMTSATSTVIDGTFLDSQSTAGVVHLTKNSSTLTPSTNLKTPPAVVIHGTSAQFEFQNFRKVTASAARNFSFGLRAAKLTRQYEVSLRGKERLQRVSKRNTVTVKNLKPGNYTATYRVTALKNGTPSYSTKFSPRTTFTIR